MREIELKGHKIEMYDGIDEMPVVRYHKFTQLMVLASGVGADIDAIRDKLLNIRNMMDDKENSKAKVEILNLYQTFAFIDKGIDPHSSAIACLVHSIDGEVQEDINGDALDKIAAKLNVWMTKAERDSTTEAVKKKIENELRYYYPEHMSEDLEEAALFKRILQRRLERIAALEDISKRDKEIDELARRIRQRRDVTNYITYEKDSDTAFEQGCLAITGELNKDAKSMTVMEYHSAMKLLEDRAKDMEKARHK